MSGRRAQRGFTLIEVLIALAILGIGLGVLMNATASSLAAAGRTRGVTIATLLARSKMVDVEQRVLDEGFTLGDVEDEGDFADDGHPEVKWKSKVLEVQLDLGALEKLGGGGDEKGGGEGGAAGMAGALGGPLEAVTKQVGDAMRVVQVTIAYPSDATHVDTLTVHSVITRDDLANAGQQAADQFRSQLEAGGAGGLGNGGLGGGGQGGGGQGGRGP